MVLSLRLTDRHEVLEIDSSRDSRSLHPKRSAVTVLEELILSLINNIGPLSTRQLKRLPEINHPEARIRSILRTLENKKLIFYVEDDLGWDTTPKGKEEVRRIFQKHREGTG